MSQFHLYKLAVLSIIAVFITIEFAYTQNAADTEQAGEDQVKLITPEDASEIIKENSGNPDFVILDVRTPGEYSQSHIESSVNIDFRSPSFKDEVGKLDRGKTYLLHCRSGQRSAGAAVVMEQMGFTDIYDMDGGMLRWEKNGLPVVK